MGIILLMIIWVLISVMAVSQPTMPTGTTASELITGLLEIMPGGTVYMGEGSYTKAEADAIYDGMDNIATEIAANLTQISCEIAEDPGALNDDGQASLPTRNSVRWGKRRMKPELNVIGINYEQMAYFDSVAFTGSDKTLVVVSSDRNDVLIFNGLRWSFKMDGQADGLITGKFMTELGGRLENYIYPYPDIADEASS